MRSIWTAVSDAARSAPGGPAEPVVRVKRANSRYEDLADIESLLLEQNHGTREVLELTITLSYPDTARLEGTSRLYVNMDTMRDRKWTQDGYLSLAMHSDRAEWVSMHCDHIATLLEGTGRDSSARAQKLTLFALFCSLVALGVLHVRRSLHVQWENVLWVAVPTVGLVAVALFVLGDLVDSFFTPPSLFAWGKAIEVLEAHERTTSLVFGTVIVGFAVSLAASLLVPILSGRRAANAQQPTEDT